MVIDGHPGPALCFGDPGIKTAGRMIYDLQRLRLNGLIDRLPHTHLYALSRVGPFVALLFTRTYARLLRQ